MEQIRSGEILFNANLKEQEEKRKLKKLRKEQKLVIQDGNKESMCLPFKLSLFSLLICSDSYASYILLF